MLDFFRTQEQQNAVKCFAVVNKEGGFMTGLTDQDDAEFQAARIVDNRNPMYAGTTVAIVVRCEPIAAMKSKSSDVDVHRFEKPA